MQLSRAITGLMTMRLRWMVALGLALALAAVPAAGLAIPGLIPFTAIALLFLGGIQLAAFGIIADYLAFTLPQLQRALEQQRAGA
ncbi:MAG TPA: hypothetical protein VEQ16_02180 [Acidocella sp.]|jgi:hypothetical protein|nr:hypothetical protein [Acidocella sp.]